MSAHTPAKQEAQGPVALNIVRRWPEGFQERLQHVWLDVVGYTPNVMLWDLQRVLAEFGFDMQVWEGNTQATSAPQPPAPCPDCAENEKTLQAIAEHVDWAFIGDLDDVVAFRINERNDAIAHFAAERDVLQAKAAELEKEIEVAKSAARYHATQTNEVNVVVAEQGAEIERIAAENRSMDEDICHYLENEQANLSTIAQQAAEIERLTKVALFKESVCALYVADIEHQTEIANNFAAQVRQKNTTIAELQSKTSVLDGLSQDAINGGWTYRGMEAYAKGLEAKVEHLAKDAARYLWLRDDRYSGPSLRMLLEEPLDSAEDYDAAIDAAISKATGAE